MCSTTSHFNLNSRGNKPTVLIKARQEEAKAVFTHQSLKPPAFCTELLSGPSQQSCPREEKLQRPVDSALHRPSAPVHGQKNTQRRRRARPGVPMDA